MVLGLAALGFKKAVKKLAPKAKAGGRAASAASTAKRAKALSRMDSQNKSATSMASDMRREIKMFKDDANKIVKESEKRLIKQGAATTGAIGAGSAAAHRRRNKRK
jgi:hypothetical protein